MRLACVVHRFGPDIAGGSERHCRFVAEHLAETHDVTVLTSCAQDHVTWRNAYPAGASRHGQLRVLRFPVARERRLHQFAQVNELVLNARSAEADQAEWFRENGPEVPELLEHLRRHGADYDVLLFWSYRYYQTFFGLPLVADRAVLVPTAEEDPLIRVDAVGRFFTKPAGYLFLTPEEQELVARYSAGTVPPSATIGCGIDPPSRSASIDLSAMRIADPFVLYLGRIDRNKGCETLVHYFEQYVARGGRSLPLVMAGPSNMPIPSHPQIRWLGAVNDVVKDALLTSARALVMPSPFESLSMVLLEAWNHGLPALVNARCRVLKGQVLRADGGLYYRHANEFAAGLDFLVDRRDVARRLGRQGQAYVEREYRWPHVMETIEELLRVVTARRASVPRAG
jgi:glycosyltransferase involved in cell wall biosynthesis